MQGLGVAGALVTGGLLFQSWTNWRFNLAAQIEVAARTQYIPQLERALGRRVEVGRFSTDWRGRMVLENIVIGRDPRLPTGALLQAKSATLSVDLVAIALGRRAFPDALTGVDLDAPQLYIRRDARGAFNLASLFKGSGSAGKRWSGRIGFTHARLVYLDTGILNRRRQPLFLDARGGAGGVMVSSPTPDASAFEFEARTARTLLRGDELGALPVRGRVVAASRAPLRGWVEAQTSVPLPATLPAQWAALPFAVRAGTFEGSVQLAWAKGAVARRGSVRLQGVALSVPRGANGAPVAVENLNGPLRFVGSALETAGMSAQVAGAPVAVRGRAALAAGEMVFDGSVRAPALPMATVRQLLGPNTLPANLGAATLNIAAHASGTGHTLRADGTVEAKKVSWRGPRGGVAHAPLLRATGVIVRNGTAPLAYAARFEAPNADFAGDVPGANRVAARAANWTGTIRSAGKVLDMNAHAADLLMSSPKWGYARAPGGQLVASTGGEGVWRGQLDIARAQTAGLKLAALSPRAGLVERTGLLSARVNFAGDPAHMNAARLAGAVSLSEAALSPAAIPPATRAQLMRVFGAGFDARRFLVGRDLAARVSIEKGVLHVAGATMQTEGGLVSGALSTPLSAPNPRYSFALPQLRVPRSVLEAAARARGVEVGGDWGATGAVSGEGDARGVAVRANIAVLAPQFAVRGRAGGARLVGSGARLVVRANVGGAAPGWNALLSCSALGVTGSGALGASGLVIPPTLGGARMAGARIAATSLPRARWTMSLDAAHLALPVHAVAGAPLVTLREVAAVVHPAREGVSVERVAANWGAAGRLDGALLLDGRGLSGQLLGRGLEARALQTLLAPASARAGTLAGAIEGQVTLAPDAAPRFAGQMARGTLTLAGRREPLALRSVALSGQSETGGVRVDTFAGWLNGARVSGVGSAQFAVGQYAGRVQLAGLTLAPLARLVGAPPLDGLARADVKLSFNAPRSFFALDGRVHLDGGAFRGASLDASEALVHGNWDTKAGEGALKLSDWRGEWEGAPFAGALALDTRANAWGLQLAAPSISLARAARLKARLQSPTAPGAVLMSLTPPVEGSASVVLDVGGSLRDRSRAFAPRLATGLARLGVPVLKWRAATLGALDGTFNVAKGRLEFSSLQLTPPDKGDGSGRAPTISLLGSVPLDGHSGPLDARLSIGEAPLDFFLEALKEGRDALAASAYSSPFLDTAVKYAGGLPRGLQGRVALEAHFGGSFAAPVLTVSRLALRDGRAPLPLGGLSLPATLDAAFTFSSGDVTFERAQFRLAKVEREPLAPSVAGASPPDPNAPEEDDTLVQVQSGSKLSLLGESSLSADVLNANLSQLAPWVPALRGKDGEPLLSGQLEGFSFAVAGAAVDPKVTASVDAQNIAFRGVKLQRLRIARLEIGGGQAKIAPGNLSVKEGRFESSAASGSVAFDWRQGLVPDGALQLRFPLATKDFGALATLFVPQVADARAEGFTGLVEVGGSLSAPQFSGEVHLQNAAFQTAPKTVSSFAVGVRGLSGALRFVGGNRLEIAPDAPLSGELVAPEAAPTPPAKGTAKARAVAAPDNGAFRVRGAFNVRGSIGLGQTDLTALSADIPAALAANTYDLRLDLARARFDSPSVSGVQNADFSASFATTNAQDPAHSQTLRWIGAGQGVKPEKTLGEGEILTRGALQLPPDFASGFAAIARATPLAWVSGNRDLPNSLAAARASNAAFGDARPQLVFKAFGAKAVGYGGGVLDGALVLDKAPAQNRAPGAARLQTISGFPSLRPLEGESGARLFGAWHETATALTGKARVREVQDTTEGGAPELPLRLGGNLQVSNAQIVGGGTGDGPVTRLSLLPDAPRLDVRLALGSDVELVNSSLHARLGGDLALSGVPSSPLLLGTVEVLDGQVRFPNSRARIDEGRVSINMARDPETDLPRTRLEVDATAHGQAGRYAVTLHLRGPVQLDARGGGENVNFHVDATSNPPLSQDQVFAQLLGVMPSGSGSAGVGPTNQAYAQAVLQVVSAPFFSGFERGVAEALGLSSVSFEYRFNEPLAFEFSKALGNRVLVTYRRSLGATATSDGRTPYQLRLDYRLKGNLYVGAQQDQRGVRTLTLGKNWSF